MNISLRQLRSFTVLARAGSFTRASEALNLSQPALTVQIRSLEGHLGLRLFDRNTRQMRLTRVGHELLPAFERLLHDLESVADNARALAAGVRGVVHLAALPSICSTVIPAAIGEVRRRHPGIVVRLRDAVAQTVLSLVRTEEVDFGIGGFDRVDADMSLTPLYSDRLVAVMPPAHPLARRQKLALENLVGVPLIVMDSQSSVRALVEQAYLEAGKVLVPAYEVTYMTTALGLVRAGEGVSLLPSTAHEVQMLAGLAARPFGARRLERTIGVVRKSGRTLSPAAEGFIAVLAEWTAKLPRPSAAQKKPAAPKGGRRHGRRNA